MNNNYYSNDTVAIPQFTRKKKVVCHTELKPITEREFMEEIITTPFEKAMKILSDIKKFLFIAQAEQDLVEDLEWVIDKVQTNSLYGYEISQKSVGTQLVNTDNIQTFLEYLNIHSEKPIQDHSSKIFKSQILRTSDLKLLQAKQRKTNSVDLPKNSFDYLSLEESIKDLTDKNFDIFEFSKIVGRERVLPSVGILAFQTSKTIDYLNTLNLTPFLEKIRNGYKETNPYHNDLHGADVCQTVAQYLCYNQNEVIELAKFKKLDVLATIVAALIHDIGHPGMTNNFLINSRNDLAITYNDKSVLENYHVAEGFRIMNSFNILAKLDDDQYKKFRKRVVEGVLSTDMVSHAKVYSLIKNKINIMEISQGKNTEQFVNTNSPNYYDEQQDLINFIIHLADISHSTKSFDISSKWTDLIMEEYWNQGDMEKSKGLQVSFLCDRDTADVPRSQIGFIRGIIMPSIDVFVEILPSFQFLKDNLESNLEKWKSAVVDK